MPWLRNNGLQPTTSAESVFVKYRRGLVSKSAYPVTKQRWTLTGDDFDIIGFFEPDEKSVEISTSSVVAAESKAA